MSKSDGYIDSTEEDDDPDTYWHKCSLEHETDKALLLKDNKGKFWAPKKVAKYDQKDQEAEIQSWFKEEIEYV